MTPHTTHFDDCGCAAEQHLAEVRKIAAERDTWKQTCEQLRVEAALVSGALCDAETVVVDPAHEGVKRLTADRDVAKAFHDVAVQQRNTAWAKCDRLEADRDAAVREADRLRHGVAIEGDFVCPDALEVTALRAEVARLRTALAGTRDVLDELDPHSESVIGRVLTLVERALKEAGDGNREA